MVWKRIESGDDIVISGMAGMFPNSDHIRHFEENLRSKADMTSDDNRRWISDDPKIPKRLGKLNEINKFDAGFFNILHNVAEMTEPMGRILLEKTYEAIIDAGYNPQEIRGSKTGVYIGSSFSNMDLSALSSPLLHSYLSVTGSTLTLLANRISFWLDARGPSYTVDTACSSSMYALEHAYSAIKAGKCESAIVGGSNICLHKQMSKAFYQTGVLSMEGRCKSFDETADGYGRAETVAVLFLQKRINARRVYAEVVHAKTGCDGYKNEGLHYPSAAEQTVLLKEFYQECTVDPCDLQFLEAHATGTKVGDPVEMKAVENALLVNRKEPLRVGSVKSNMAHAEPASAICSIVKVILSYESGYILPNISYKQFRSDIDALNAGKLKIISELTPWNGGLTGINSFGFGGANAHTLLNSNNKVKVNGGLPDDNIPRLVVASGRTEEAVDVILNDLENRPLDAEYVALFHKIYEQTIGGHTYRGFTVLHRNQETAIVRSIQYYPEDKRPIWFVYSGIGSQWNTMGTSIMQIPVINESINQCHRILSSKGIDLIKILTDDDKSIFSNILNSYCGIVAIEIALTDMMRVIGVEPVGIIGHSVGEFGCAYADGCLTLEETILLAYYRGLAMNELESIPGLMAAVGMSAKELKLILPHSIDMACHNGPDNCTISGPREDVAHFVEVLKKKNKFVKTIESSDTALHSRYINEIGQWFLEKTKRLLPKPTMRSKKWLSSTYTDAEWGSEASQYASIEYFVKNIVGTVYFDEVCKHVPKDAIVIEIAPHGLLQGILKRSLKESVNIPLANNKHPNNLLHLLAAVGKLYEAGVNPQISKLYPPVEFPVSRGTPSISSLVRWDHSQDWNTFREIDDVRLKQGKRSVMVTLKDDEHRYLAGHVIRGKIFYPATGYVVLAWETFSMMNGSPMSKTPVKLRDVRFLRFSGISDKVYTTFDVIIFKNSGDFQITEQGELVVKGNISLMEENVDNQSNSEYIDSDDAEYQLTGTDFYNIAKIDYQGLFRSVMRINYDRTRAKVAWHDNYVTFIDGVLQVSVLARAENQIGAVVPTGIETVIIDPIKHERILKTIDSENAEITAFASLDPDEIHCGGVTLENTQITLFSLGKVNQKCVLEKLQFVPYSYPKLLDSNDVIRACAQLISENSGSTEIKIVEILTNGSVPGALISPQMDEALNDLPLVKDEIIIQAAENDPVVTNEFRKCFQVQTRALTDDESCCLIIALGVLENKETLATYLNSLQKEGFILTRENIVDTNFTEKMGLVVCFQCQVNDEKLILLRKKTCVDYEILATKISNNFYEWVSPLQDTLYNAVTNQKIVLYSDKEPLSGLLGFFNVIVKENPKQNICCFFVMDDDTPPFDLHNSFYKNQLAKNLRVNVCKSGVWGSYRHLPLHDTEISRSHYKYLSMLSYGDLSTLRWFEGPLEPPMYVTAEGKAALISVHCAALNFRDIMVATGKMDPSIVTSDSSDQACALGAEFAGELPDGRRVMGIARSRAFGNYIVGRSRYLWPVPDDWSLEQAVTVPLVYCTVLHSLFCFGPLNRGTSILIHCVAGGVGIAAINICLHYGFEIFTTVGTTEKRNFIKNTFPSISDDHIGSSRDCTFEKMVKRGTKGAGVDIVLNSLTEDKMLASIRCLKPGGRFIEIGKYDMVVNNSIDLKVFLKGICFHTVDLMKITRDQPVWDKLKLMLENALKEGIVKPLPATVFPADEAEAAFRFMASGKHIGKVIVKIRENGRLQLHNMNCTPRIYFNSNKSYILCGGLGSLGIELADWLFSRGARKLILTSRSGITNGYQGWYKRRWEQSGAKVIVSKGDIGDKIFVRQLLEMANSIGSVAGIFNLAAVLVDKMFDNQSAESFEESAKPKAWGTSHLDEISRELCPELDHFVVYSSVSCGLGTAGQSNYAMSNSIMERICESRKADGLPALAIEFGPVGNVGIFMKMLKNLQKKREGEPSANLSAENEQMQEWRNNSAISFGGYHAQNLDSCLAAHDQFLSQSNPVVLSMVIAEKSSSFKKGRSLSETIAFILGIKRVESINPNVTLPQLGMDSMTNSEIREILRNEWNIDLALKDVANLTFNRLKEMEVEFSNLNSYVKKDETDIMITDFIFYYLLFSRNINFNVVEPIVEMSSAVKNGSVQKVPKIFICPGLDGLAHAVWLEFSKNLGNHVFTFQYKYINPSQSIAEISHICHQEIIKILPLDEPFFIVGQSFGAFVAMDLVLLLEKEGRTGRMWLLDNNVGFVVPKLMDENVNQTSHVMDALAEGVKKFSTKYRHEFSDEKLITEFLDILDHDTAEVRAIIEDKLHSAPPGVASPFYAVWYLRLKALHLYDAPSPNSIKAKATLIRTMKTDSDTPDDYGNSQFFKEPINIQYIKANHFTIINKAETIETILNEMKPCWEEFIKKQMLNHVC